MGFPLFRETSKRRRCEVVGFTKHMVDWRGSLVEVSGQVQLVLYGVIEHPKLIHGFQCPTWASSTAGTLGAIGSTFAY